MTQSDQLEQQILGVKEGFDHLGPCGYSSTGTNFLKTISCTRKLFCSGTVYVGLFFSVYHAFFFLFLLNVWTIFVARLLAGTCFICRRTLIKLNFP